MNKVLYLVLILSSGLLFGANHVSIATVSGEEVQVSWKELQRVYLAETNGSPVVFTSAINNSDGSVTYYEPLFRLGEGKFALIGFYGSSQSGACSRLGHSAAMSGDSRFIRSGTILSMNSLGKVSQVNHLSHGNVLELLTCADD